MSVAKKRIHELVERLPETDEPVVLRYLEFLAEGSKARIARSLANAPIDDEPLTQEDWEAIRKGEENISHGHVISVEDALREL